MFRYTLYPYAPLSTLLSAFTSLLIAFFGIGSVFMLLEVIYDIDFEGILTVFFLILLLIFSFWLKKVSVKAAALETIKKYTFKS